MFTKILPKTIKKKMLITFCPGAEILCWSIQEGCIRCSGIVLCITLYSRDMPDVEGSRNTTSTCLHACIGGYTSWPGQANRVCTLCYMVPLFPDTWIVFYPPPPLLCIFQTTYRDLKLLLHVLILLMESSKMNVYTCVYMINTMVYDLLFSTLIRYLNNLCCLCFDSWPPETYLELFFLFAGVTCIWWVWLLHWTRS